MTDSRKNVFTESDLITHPWLATKVSDLIDEIHKDAEDRRHKILRTRTQNSLMDGPKKRIIYIAEILTYTERGINRKPYLPEGGMEILQPVLDHCGLSLGTHFKGFNFDDIPPMKRLMSDGVSGPSSKMHIGFALTLVSGRVRFMNHPNL